MIEKFLTTSDENEWRRALPASRSVFGSIEFAHICERYRGYSPRLYVSESATASVCHPMLLRPVADLPFATDIVDRWDSTTPDYTGPVLQGHDDFLASEFRRCYTSFTRENGIVAEFAHVHPWSQAKDLLGEDCVYNRNVVWVDVSLEPETLFRDHFEHSARKNINKAQRDGVQVYTDTTDEAIEEFHRIYISTMQRNQALDRYHFTAEYFAGIRNEMPDNARFVFAEYRGAIIAATLYLYDDADVHSYLGGADAEFNAVRPTNLIVWNTICWAHQTGKKHLVLGGGYRPNDGIYRFKATFSPLRQPFYVYKQIYRCEDFALLEQRRREYTGIGSQHVDYFPSYRAVRTVHTS